MWEIGGKQLWEVGDWGQKLWEVGDWGSKIVGGGRWAPLCHPPHMMRHGSILVTYMTVYNQMSINDCARSPKFSRRQTVYSPEQNSARSQSQSETQSQTPPRCQPRDETVRYILDQPLPHNHICSL